MLSLQMLHPIFGPFIQGSGFVLSCSETWLGSMCKDHIVLQDLSMLLKLADMHGISLIAAYIPTQLMWKLTICHEEVGSRVAYSSSQS